jgi:hypothetical protein
MMSEDERLKKIWFYFLFKDFLWSWFFSFLFYMMASVGDPHSNFFGIFLFLFILIFTPAYLIKNAIEKSKNLTLESGVLRYRHGIIEKKDSSIPLNSIKIVQLKQGITIGWFGLTRLFITVEVPMSLSVSRENVNVNNSQIIVYIESEEAAQNFRDSLNKLISPTTN